MNSGRASRNLRLRAAREAHRLTQAEVAKRLGTSALTVSRWELGVQSPVPYHRQQLCSMYGLSAAELGLARSAEPEGASSTAVGRDLRPEWPGLGRTAAHARRDVLTQVQRYWFGSQLDAATSALPGLTLPVVERRGAVDDPRSVSARRSGGGTPLPRIAGIREAHRRLGEQLLILGDPGAGKTTMLLQLGAGLAAECWRDPAAPIPVVFHLASWASERRPLDAWLAGELHRRYGVARQLGVRWIETEQVMPLLDGLDQVADRDRAACAAAINDFRLAHGQLPLAVCCRTAWYRSLGLRLTLRGAVEIRPLEPAEVRRYLREAGLAGVRAMLAGDQQLEELLTTPLLLRIAAATCGDRPRAEPGHDATPGDRRRQVLGDYAHAMLSRPPRAVPFTGDQTRRWLTWLARRMRDHGQSIFDPDWLRPGWLPRGARPWHRALARVLVPWGRAPRDSEALLQHASRLAILRRRGAGYEFIHQLLLEHFAAAT